MNKIYLNILAIFLALVFASGCAVYVRDDDWHHHHHHGYWHSSTLQPSSNITNRDTFAKNMVTHAPVNLGH